MRSLLGINTSKGQAMEGIGSEGIKKVLQQWAERILRFEKNAPIVLGEGKDFEAFWREVADYVDFIWNHEDLREEFERRIRFAKDAKQHPEFSTRLSDVKGAFLAAVNSVRERVQNFPESSKKRFFEPDDYASQILACGDYLAAGRRYSCEFFLARFEQKVNEWFSIDRVVESIRGQAFSKARVFSDKVLLADVNNEFLREFNNILESLDHLQPGASRGILTRPFHDAAEAFDSWLNNRVLCGCKSFMDLVGVYVGYGGGMDRCAEAMIGPEPLSCPPSVFNPCIPRDDEYSRAFDTAQKAVEAVCQDLCEHLRERASHEAPSPKERKGQVSGGEAKGEGSDGSCDSKRGGAPSQTIIYQISGSSIGQLHGSTQVGFIANKPEAEAVFISSWANGSFYLFAFLSVIGAVAALLRIVTVYALPVIVVTGILAVLVIGLMQLRMDKKLSEKSFVELLKMVVKQLPLIGKAVGSFREKK